MVTVVGLLACLLIAALPVAVQPDMHLLAAGSAAALICTGGLLMSSLGLAVTGAIAALIVFSIALLMASGENACIEALLMGVALLTLLDSTHYRQRFNGASVDRPVTRAHLANLAMSVIVSLGVAALLAILAGALSIRLASSVRPMVAAAGTILVMVAVLRATHGVTTHPLPEQADADHQNDEQR